MDQIDEEHKQTQTRKGKIDMQKAQQNTSSSPEKRSIREESFYLGTEMGDCTRKGDEDIEDEVGDEDESASESDEPEGDGDGMDSITNIKEKQVRRKEGSQW
jgi:hypothetical protein